MDKRPQRFVRQYVAALKEYLALENEAGLETAYRLGWQAIAARLGVLEMARLHQYSIEDALRGRQRSKFKAAETFFLEILSPFEVTHRGFRETNTRLAQLIETLEQRNNDLAALSNQILHIQEAERKHISRELHDEVGQALTAISVALAGLKNNGGCAALKKRIGTAQKLLSGTMELVHNFARELRPPMLDELGLLPALRSMSKSFSERTKLPVRFHGEATAEQLSAAQKTVLFRVAQESLTNVARHARAGSVEIAIRKRVHGICMTIADDGRSFKYVPEQSGDVHQRLGLLGMQERVRLIHGQFNVLARPGKGTTIRVIIPLLDSSKTPEAPAGHGERIAKIKRR